MRKVGVPLLTSLIGIAIGVLIAAPRAPEPEAAPLPGVGFAAAPGEKGGQDLFGAYEPVPDWPKPLSRPAGHDNWTWGSAEGVFPESPDPVCMVQRGELPAVERPKGRPAPGSGTA